MTKEKALELLSKNIKEMTPEERKKLLDAIKIISTIKRPL